MELTPEEARERCLSKGWVSPYERVATLVGRREDRVLLVEDHPTPTGSDWMIRQYAATSPLVERAWREGRRHFFLLRVGRADLRLEPGVRAAGVERVEVTDGEVRVTHAGLAGAGVGATLARGCAEGVLRVEIHEEGGGARLGRGTVVTPKLRRLLIGVDDTDTRERGATWSAVDAVCRELERAWERVFYSRHVTVQLYPGAPDRTQNCAAAVVELGVPPDRLEAVKEDFLDRLADRCFSGSTCVAFWEGLEVPQGVLDLGHAAKLRVVRPEEAEAVIEREGIEVIALGERDRGKIGAVAALAFIDRPELAARAPKSPYRP
ncbi:MAG: methanogenesis marker protein 11 [Euryarchaeota archaeon]